jgi:hypothetical protein
MRLLELRTAGMEPFAVSLHPRMAVVFADPEMRARLLSALSTVLAGGDASVGGLLEASGVRVDLDPSSLAAIGLDRGLEDVVRAEDLPGSRAGELVRARRRAAAETAILRDQAVARRADTARAVVALHELQELLGNARNELDAVRTRAQSQASLRVSLQRAFQAEEFAAAEAGGLRVRHLEMLARIAELEREAGSVRLEAERRLAQLDALIAQHDEAVAALAATPVMAAPVMAPPVMAPPVMAAPVMAAPVMAPPVMAPPVMAPPVMAPPRWQRR